MDSANYNSKNLSNEEHSKFKIFHDEAGIGIGIYNEQGDVISYNKIAAQYMGGKPSDFIGKNILQVFSKQEGEKYLKRIKKCLVSEIPIHFEDDLVFNGKEYCFYSIFNKIQQGDKNYVQIISQDITHLLIRERDIKEKEKEYQSVFENSADGILIMSETEIIDCNKQVCALFGYKKEKIIGNSLFKFSTKNQSGNESSIDLGNKYIQKVLKEGFLKFEWNHKHKNGEIIPVIISLKRIEINGEKRLLAILHNLSEVYNYQKLLKEKNEEYAAVNEELSEANKRLQIINKHVELNEAKFRAAFKTSPDSININRLSDGLYLEINEGFTRLTGFTEDDVKGKSSADINIWVNKEDREELVRGLKKKGFYNNLQAEFRRKDGSTATALMSANVINVNNEPCILSITRDISERINNQEKIEQQEKYLRTIIQAHNDGFWIVDKHGQIIDVNKAYCEMTGFSKEELLKMTIRDQDTVEDSKEAKDRMKRIRKNGFEVFTTKHKRKNKPDVDVEVSVTYLDINGGQYICFSRDITEKVEIEKQLQLKDFAIESSLSAIGLADLNGIIFYVNKSYVDLWGYKNAEEIIGKHISEFAFLKDQVNDVYQSMLNDKPFSGEGLSIKKDGTKFYTEIAANVVKSDKGEPLYLMASFIDITKRKKAEREIARLATMVDVAPNAILIHDFNGDVLFTNEKNLELHGYTREEFMKLNIISDIDLPVSAELFNERTKRISEKGEASFEVEHYRKNGTIFPLMLYVKMVEWEGMPAMLSIGTDITERKQAEEQIIKEKEWSDKIVNQAPNLVVGLGVGSEILIFNKYAEKLTGYKAEEVLGKSWIDTFIAKELRNGIKLVWKEAVSNHSIVHNHENEILTKSGEKRFIRWGNSVLTDQGKFQMVVSIGEDITELRKTMDALIKSEERINSIFRVAPVGIGIVINRVFTDLNEKVCQMTGYLKDELIGKNAQMVYPSKKEYEFVGTEKYRQIEEKGTGTVETVWKKKDGNLINVLLSSTPLDQNDFSKGVTFTVLDITERKKAEQEVKHSHELMQYIIEHNRGAVAVHDKDLNYVYVSQTYLDQYQVKEKNILGKHHYEVFPDLPQKWRDVHQKALKGEIISAEDDEYYREDGTKEWTRWDCRPWYEANGTIGGIIVYTEITTKQKELQQSLECSLERNKALLDSNPDLMFVFTAEGEIIDCKSDDKDKLYADPNVFISKNVRDVLPNEIANLTLKKINEVKKTGKTQIYSYSLPIKGKDQYFESRLVNYGGNRFLAIVRDITKARQDEIKLRESEQNLKDAQKIAKLGHWELDHKKGELIWSEETYEIFDFEDIENKITYNKFLKLVHPEDRKIVERAYKESLEDQLPYELSHRIVTNKSEIKYVKEKCRTSFDKEGNPIKSIGIIHDITDLKLTEINLIKAKEKAEESDRLKSAFLANMSHEIRTPMNAILGFSNLLKEKDFDKEKRDRFLYIINQRTKDLLRIIDDVIDISKIEANQLSIEKNEFSFTNMLATIYNAAEAQLQSENREEIKIVMNPELIKKPLSVQSDENRLRQVFSNLIHNALKFTEKGQIEIGYEIKKHKLIFYVKDTGIGIPKDLQGIIFERFRQVDDSTTRKYGGTGLGLPICKNIMELLGGEMWLKSKPAKGSEFYFAIPYEQANGEPVQKEQALYNVTYNWEDKTVLIVEDDLVSLYFLVEALEDTRVNIVKAYDGEQALKQLKEKPNTDMVLLDINLPDTNGNDLVQKIKKENKNIKVIAQSAYSMVDEVKKSMKKGFDDYVTKPIDTRLLLSTMNRFLKDSN